MTKQTVRLTYRHTSKVHSTDTCTRGPPQHLDAHMCNPQTNSEHVARAQVMNRAYPGLEYTRDPSASATTNPTPPHPRHHQIWPAGSKSAQINLHRGRGPVHILLGPSLAGKRSEVYDLRRAAPSPISRPRGVPLFGSSPLCVEAGAPRAPSIPDVDQKLPNLFPERSLLS